MIIELTDRQAETIYNALVDAKNITQKQMEEYINKPNKVRMFQHQLKAIDETLVLFDNVMR